MPAPRAMYDQEIPSSRINRTALVVAAADAPASVKRIAHYQCSGTDDQLTIQQAIDQGATSIYLPPGTYYLDEPIRLGSGSVHLRGRL